MGGRWVGPVAGGRFAFWSFSPALVTEAAHIGVSLGKKECMCTYVLSSRQIVDTDVECMVSASPLQHKIVQ